MTPQAAAALAGAARVLKLEGPATVRITGFVGSFENNAFTMIGADRVPTLALPIEGDPAKMAGSSMTLSLCDEVALAVGPSYLRTVAASLG